MTIGIFGFLAYVAALVRADYAIQNGTAYVPAGSIEFEIVLGVALIMSLLLGVGIMVVITSEHFLR
jgi:hypothetical protein